MLDDKMNNNFLVNFNTIYYEKIKIFWFFYNKTLFKLYLDKNSNKSSIKNFYFYSFSYNIYILNHFDENKVNKFDNKKNLNKINKMIFFSLFKLFFIKHWNIEFIFIILNIFLKSVLKKNYENLIKWIHTIIKVIPINQLKFFQNFFFILFEFKFKNFLNLSNIFENYLKKLITYLSRIYKHCQYIKYFFFFVFKLNKKSNKMTKLYLYGYWILKNVKNLIIRKQKIFFEIKKINNIQILYSTSKLTNQKYIIIKRIFI